MYRYYRHLLRMARVFYNVETNFFFPFQLDFYTVSLVFPVGLLFIYFLRGTTVF